MRPAGSPAMAPRPCPACARPWRSDGSRTPRSTSASPPRRSTTTRPSSIGRPPSSMAAERPLDGAVIALDLDGTLVDTAPDLVGTLNVILAEEGLAPLAMRHARDLIGHGARR